MHRVKNRSAESTRFCQRDRPLFHRRQTDKISPFRASTTHRSSYSFHANRESTYVSYRLRSVRKIDGEKEREKERKRIDRVCRLGLVNFYVHVAGKQPRITRLLISWFELKAGEATGEPAVGLCEGPRERPFGPLCIAEAHRTSHSPTGSSPSEICLSTPPPLSYSSLLHRRLSFLQCFGRRIFFSLDFFLTYVFRFANFGFIFSCRRFRLGSQFWIFLSIASVFVSSWNFSNFAAFVFLFSIVEDFNWIERLFDSFCSFDLLLVP